MASSRSPSLLPFALVGLEVGEGLHHGSRIGKVQMRDCQPRSCVDCWMCGVVQLAARVPDLEPRSLGIPSSLHQNKEVALDASRFLASRRDRLFKTWQRIRCAKELKIESRPLPR